MTSRQSLNGSPLAKAVKATLAGDTSPFNIEKKKLCQTLASEIFCHVTKDFKATFQTSQQLYEKWIQWMTGRKSSRQSLATQMSLKNWSSGSDIQFKYTLGQNLKPVWIESSSRFGSLYLQMDPNEVFLRKSLIRYHERLHLSQMQKSTLDLKKKKIYYIRLKQFGGNFLFASFGFISVSNNYLQWQHTHQFNAFKNIKKMGCNFMVIMNLCAKLKFRFWHPWLASTWIVANTRTTAEWHHEWLSSEGDNETVSFHQQPLISWVRVSNPALLIGSSVLMFPGPPLLPHGINQDGSMQLLSQRLHQLRLGKTTKLVLGEFQTFSTRVRLFFLPPFTGFLFSSAKALISICWTK